jgi:hypothetical protein
MNKPEEKLLKIKIYVAKNMTDEWREDIYKGHIFRTNCMYSKHVSFIFKCV